MVWKLDDALQEAREWPGAVAETQKFYLLLLAKNRLEQDDGQAILTKTANPFAKMLSKRGGVRARNHKVKVDIDKRQTSKKAVHHELECGASVAQPKVIQRNSKRLKG